MAGNFESFETLEEATKALTSTAQRAATLMRQEADRARQEAGKAREDAERAWDQIETVREDILSAKTEIDAVRNSIFSAESENQRVRASARFAWGAVGVMAVLMMVAVGWTASVLTRSNTRLSYLNEKLAEVATVSDGRASELERLRTEISVARIAQARAEGELRAVSYTRTASHDVLLSEPAVQQPVDIQFNTAGPTTRPTLNLKEMLSTLIPSDTEVLQRLGELSTSGLSALNANEAPTAIPAEAPVVVPSAASSVAAEAPPADAAAATPAEAPAVEVTELPTKE